MNNIRYAYDTGLLSETEGDIQDIIEVINKESEVMDSV